MNYGVPGVHNQFNSVALSSCFCYKGQKLRGLYKRKILPIVVVFFSLSLRMFQNGHSSIEKKNDFEYYFNLGP